MQVLDLELIPPKITWKDGDSFTLETDYHRIKSNLEIIYEVAAFLWGDMEMPPLGTYTINDFVYPFFMNDIVTATQNLHDTIYNPDGWEDMRTYIGNRPGWKAYDLNIIENNALLIGNAVLGQYNILPKLSFEIGGGEF